MNSLINRFLGIAHNKLLAKLVGSKNKPNDQTVIASSAVPELIKPDHLVTSIPGELHEIAIINVYRRINFILSAFLLDFIYSNFGLCHGWWNYYCNRIYIFQNYNVIKEIK